MLQSMHANSKTEAAMARRFTNAKNDQLQAAVQYCKDNNVRGHKALQTGQFPLIKDRETINRRLDGKIKTGEERRYCTIFTPEEEESVVRFIKNKNRSLQGINKSELTKLLLDILRIKDYMNKKCRGGRKFLALSPNAKSALEKGKLSRSFWRRFHAKHSTLTVKRQGHVSVNRALNCTRKMACNHLNDLAEELIAAGMVTNAERVDTGVWKGDIDTGRIFNNDETPQFVSYGVDGTSSGLVYAGRGDQCQKMQKENRECVTIHPFVSFSGDVCTCQVIFSSTGITSHMAPSVAVQNIEHLLVTTSEHGMSDHTTFMSACEEFDAYLTEHRVKRPVVLMSDGHSSRYDFDTLKFLLSKQIWLFITPPDTTGVTQLLDQLNKNLHYEYKKSKDALFNAMHSLNREAFMIILAEIWDKWTNKQVLVSAAKRVGVTSTSLNANFMQQDKFDRAEFCIQASPSTAHTISTAATPNKSLIVSPCNKRKGSAMYWKDKFDQAQSLIKEMAERSIQLEEVPGLLTIKKVKPNLQKTSTRVTQVHGSMRAKDVAAKVKDIKEQKQRKVLAKEDAKKKKEETKEVFLRCKDKCTCLKRRCLAIGLKQCPACKNVLRSVCSKANCRLDGAKPIMILPAKQKPAACKRLFYKDDEDDGKDEDTEEDTHDSCSLEDEEDEEVNEESFDEDNSIGQFFMRNRKSKKT